MRFSSLTFDDSGMYQCIAESHHGLLYANAELRVYGESRFDCGPISCTLDNLFIYFLQSMHILLNLINQTVPPQPVLPRLNTTP